MYSRNTATLRRLNILQRILTTNQAGLGVQRNLVRAFNVDGKLTIDDVTKEIRPPKNPEYVPQKFRKCFCVIKAFSYNLVNIEPIIKYHAWLRTQ